VRRHSATKNEQMGDELKADVTLLPHEIADLIRCLESDARYLVLPTSTDSVILLRIVRHPASLEPREDVEISSVKHVVVTFHVATRSDREALIRLITTCLTRDDRPVVFESL
jgi:hypothetical protein